MTDIFYEYEERAGKYEFDAGMDRKHAELRAYDDMCEKYGRSVVDKEIARNERK